MRRLWLWILLALAAAGGGVWLGGRAPGRRVLEDQCRRFLEERRQEEWRHRQAMGEIERQRRAGVDTLGQVRAVRERFDRYLGEHKRLEIRGWAVALVPAGAVPPAADGYRRTGTFDVSQANDRAVLRGPMEAWVKPVGPLARFLHRLGATP